MEFVKCFTPVRFPKCLILIEKKTHKSRHFWQTIEKIGCFSFLGKSRLNFIEKVIVGVNS